MLIYVCVYVCVNMMCFVLCCVGLCCVMLCSVVVLGSLAILLGIFGCWSRLFLEYEYISTVAGLTKWIVTHYIQIYLSLI